MATLSHLPNPSLTTFQTSSYTIPAGRYAIAKPLHAGCTVNGVELFLNTSLTTSFELTNSTQIGGIPFGFTGRLTTNASATLKRMYMLYQATPGAATYSLSGSTQIAGSGVAVSLFFRNGFPQIAFTGGLAVSNNNFLNFVFDISSAASTVFTFTPSELFPVDCKSGDILSGGAWAIQEYGG